MTEPRTCPRCAAPIPADSPPSAVCPRCLLEAGLGVETLDEGKRPTVPSPEELAPYFPELDVLELVGNGGMGVVYRARQQRLDRIVALKIIAPGVADDPAFADRFTREAQALARLSHPNIVTVHDFGESGGLYYFIMEYVDGSNLRALLREQRLEPSHALAIVPQICEALQYAHDRGVVHRDIKPENVLLTRSGELKIADFGLAKLVSSGTDVTLSFDDRVMGTPVYMAPEQIEQPATVDHRADIYSLGVVFYEMLTGELPLGRFAPPSRKAQVDVRLDEVVLRALEKERDLRYQRVDDVKTGIDGLDGDDVAGERKNEDSQKPGIVDAAENLASAVQDVVQATVGVKVPTYVKTIEFPGFGSGKKVSRLALVGCLCAIFGSVASQALSWYMVYQVASRAVMEMSELLVFMPFIGLAGLTMLTGLGLSISGWVAIRRKPDELRGLSLAITGTAVPIVTLVLAPLLFLVG